MASGWSVPVALRTVRKRQGLTQAQVAKRMGLTTAAYQHYEGGRSEPRMSDVTALAAAMKVHPCSFFDEPATASLGQQLATDALAVAMQVPEDQLRQFLDFLAWQEDRHMTPGNH